MQKKPLINNDAVFKEAVFLVRDLGNAKITGVSLREYLQFKGVSLWEAIAPFLASSVFPLVLGRQKEKRDLRRNLLNVLHKTAKPYLKHFRDRVNDRLHKQSVSLEDLDKSENGNISILSLAFEPRHYQEIFAPLLDHPEVKNCFRLVVIGSRYRARQEGFKKSDLIFVEDSFHYILAKENKAEARLILRKLKKAKRVLQKRLRERYPASQRLFMQELSNFFIWEFQSLIRQIIVAEKVIGKAKPNLIVSGDDCDPRARVYFLMAKAKNIPSLLVQQGVAAANAVEWLFLSVDKAAIFGNYTKQLLEKLGVETKKLVITGQPRFDHLVGNNDADARGSVARALGIPDGQKIVLFTSQPNAPAAFFSEAVRRKAIETIYRLAAELKDTVLVVKPHPDEKPEFHQQLGRELKLRNVFITPKRSNTHELIKACDILITFHSTTALEAILASKPVIIANFFGNDKIFYVESQAAVEACSEKEVLEKIEAALHDSKTKERLKAGRERFVTEHIYNADGGAGQRLINLMREMAVVSK